MKKYLIIMLILLTQSAFAHNTTLDKIENSIYGFTYSKESDLQRVERIEKKVYGLKGSGQIQGRITKLKKDLSADLIGQEIEAKEDTFMDEDDYITYEKEPKESAKIDYPVINELEKQVFNKEFKEQNIKTRLSNLEKKTFNKSYDNDDLSSRVDRLRAQIKPQSFASNGMKQQSNDFYTDSADKMAQDYYIPQYGAPFDYDEYNSRHKYNTNNNVFKPAQKPLNLTAIEKKLYKTKYENQPTSERLTRIENSVFGTSFVNDTNSQRMERISSAIQAQKSAGKYDSDKFSRNMATAFQIGTLILMVLACIL